MCLIQKLIQTRLSRCTWRRREVKNKEIKGKKNRQNAGIIGLVWCACVVVLFVQESHVLWGVNLKVGSIIPLCSRTIITGVSTPAGCIVPCTSVCSVPEDKDRSHVRSEARGPDPNRATSARSRFLSLLLLPVRLLCLFFLFLFFFQFTYDVFPLFYDFSWKNFFIFRGYKHLLFLLILFVWEEERRPHTLEQCDCNSKSGRGGISEVDKMKGKKKEER